MSRLVRIKRKYETWKDRSKDDLSLFLGSRSACSWYFFQMNFQNYRYIEAAYVRCDIQYDSEYFSCVKFYKCNIIPARCFQAFVVKKKRTIVTEFVGLFVACLHMPPYCLRSTKIRGGGRLQREVKISEVS